MLHRRPPPARWRPRLPVALILIGVVFICGIAAADGGPEGSTSRFGVNGGIYPALRQGDARIRQVTRELANLGPVWLRNAGRGMAWFEMQPTRDTWDFGKADAVLEDNPNDWVFMLYRWDAYPFSDGFSAEGLAARQGKRATIEYIAAHQADLSDPAHRADAEVYVKAVVQRYGHRIHHWEVGAEGITSPARLEFIRHTYGWVKEVDPQAQVLVTAVAGDDEATFQRGLEALDALLEAGAGAWFDLGNVHYYGLTGADLEARVERNYAAYRDLLRRHGVDKPIWVTETSTSSAADSALSGPSSERVQARDVVRRLVVFAASGAEKVLWHNYRVTHAGDRFDGCNLVAAGSGPKPAYHAFQALVARIGHYERVDTLRADDVRAYRFHNPDGSVVSVAWAREETRVDLSRDLGADLVATDIAAPPDTRGIGRPVAGNAIPLGPDPVFLELAAGP